jgi:hypothetical protein
MTPYFVMVIVMLAGNKDGGVAMDKVGVYESRSDCMASGTDAGLAHLSAFPGAGNVYFTCVSAGDPFGAPE